MKYQVYAILAGILFGSVGVFVRELASAGIGNVTIIAQRSLFAAAMLAVWFLLTDRTLFRIRIRDIGIIAAAGLGGMMLLNLAFNIAVENLTLSFAAVLLSIFPVFVLFMSVPLFGEKVTGRKIICILLALLGCALVSGFLQNLDSLPFTPLGVLAGLLAAVFYAVYSITSKMAMQRGYEGLTVTFYAILCIAIVLTPFADWDAVIDYAAAAPLPHMAVLIAHALCTSVLSYVCYTVSLQHIDAGKAAILASCEPAAAMAFGLIIYHEVPSLWMLAGLVLTIAALSVMSLPEKS